MPHPADRPGPIAAALFAGLRDGSAGFVTRLGLSLASAAAGVGTLMLAFGLAEAARRRISDTQVALGVLIVLIAWVAVLYALWATYSRKRHVVKTIIACLGLAVLAVALSVLFGVSMRSPEFFIAGTLFLAAAGIGTVITAAAHRGARGHAITGEHGLVSVLCPACGYSMAGLDACACPECGARFTLDELIRAQDYEALKDTARQALPAGAPPTVRPGAGPLYLGPAHSGGGFDQPGVIVPGGVDAG